MPGSGSRAAAFLAAPRHDDGIGGQPAVEDLVPPDQPPAVLRKETADAVDGVALQLIDRLQPFALHARLTLRALLPRRLGSLVAADVDVFRGEELHHLREHVLEKLEGRVVADAEIAARVGFALAREPGIDGQHLLRVAGHLDLGDHRDVQRIGIGHHLADLLLGIVAARSLRVIETAVFRSAVAPLLPRRAATPRGHFGQ